MKNRERILIVGGGIAGLTAALELARQGLPSLLVEQREQVGGWAGTYTCKAVDGRCQKCGVCLVTDAVKEVQETREIEISLQTSVLDLRRDGGAFLGRFKKGEGETSGRFSAVMLCHGFEPFDPRQKSNLGYGRISNLVTGQELEEMLKEKGGPVRPSDGKSPRDLAFVQCVGSRNPSLGRGYCSQVCCGYALRMAKQIKANHPATRITFFYMDIQTFGRDFPRLFFELRDDIYWIREIPGDFYQAEGERVGVTVEDEGEIEDLAFDLMVLSVGMGPSDNERAFEEWLDLRRGQEGFLVSPGEGGIFLAGSASGPMTIPHTIAHTKATVSQVTDYLEERV
ncbi:MAG: FAD-dependent oxidoreductase [Desulfatiglandaceae bacterium]